MLDFVVEGTRGRRDRAAETNGLDPGQRAGHATWLCDHCTDAPSVQITSLHDRDCFQETLVRAAADLRRTGVADCLPLRAAARLKSLDVTGTSIPNPSTLIHTRLGFVPAIFQGIGRSRPPIYSPPLASKYGRAGLVRFA
jgi:hypothetical protein